MFLSYRRNIWQEPLKDWRQLSHLKCDMWIVSVVLPRKIFKVKNILVLRLTCASGWHWGVLPSLQLLIQKGVSMCRSWCVSAGSYSSPAHLRWCLKWMSLFRKFNLAMRSTSMGNTVCLCNFTIFNICINNCNQDSYSGLISPVVHTLFLLTLRTELNTTAFFLDIQYQSK